MDKLFSDHAQLEINNKVKDILCHLCMIGSLSSFQHQNFAEQRYRDIKAKVNSALNVTGAPPHTWLLCMAYISFVFN